MPLVAFEIDLGNHLETLEHTLDQDAGMEHTLKSGEARLNVHVTCKRL